MSNDETYCSTSPDSPETEMKHPCVHLFMGLLFTRDAEDSLLPWCIKNHHRFVHIPTGHVATLIRHSIMTCLMLCCCCAPQVIPKSLFCCFAIREYVFVVCRTKGFSAEHSQSSVLPFPACLLPTVHPALFSKGKWHRVTWSPPWPKIKSACISPGHLLLSHGPVLMLMSPSDRRQLGRSSSDYCSIDKDIINVFHFWS